MQKIIATPNNFAKVISDELRQAAEREIQYLERMFDEEATAAMEDLKRRSPKDSGKYAESWTLKRPSKRALGNKINVGRRTYTIYNKDHYRLTHLIEKGAIRATKGIMPATPHISPAYEEAKKNIENRLGGI